MLQSPQTVVDDCELCLQIPATVEHLRTVRLVAADAAERAGFDCDETDDLRIAVDEMCHTVLKSTDAPIVTRFSVTPGVVEVRGAAERRGAHRALQLSRLSQLIVGCVCDDVELVDDTSQICFVLAKRTSTAAARGA
jgi:hypothetical protein